MIENADSGIARHSQMQNYEVATHLVGLVIVLRVVLKHVWPLLVVERLGQVVCSKILPPFFAINEPVAKI
jgi:hypothetical protein